MISLEGDQDVRSLTNMNGDLDHEASLMDVGLDSLAMDELLSKLHSCFNMELPAVIFFGHPTVLDMTTHLFGFLMLENNESVDEGSLKIMERHVTSNGFSIVGMCCHFSGSVTSPGSFGEFLHAGSHSSTIIPFDRCDIWSLILARSNLSQK